MLVYCQRSEEKGIELEFNFYVAHVAEPTYNVYG
jgi:hypothetical protein